MGPLQGLKVVDLTSMVSGPVAAMMLADQGAAVVKVEPPQGEQMRFLGPPTNELPAAFFLQSWKDFPCLGSQGRSRARSFVEVDR